MRFDLSFKVSTLFAVALAGFDANFLTQGGPPASVWLAGAAATSPAVVGLRTPGRGADQRPGNWPDQIGSNVNADELGTDVSKPPRVTWGCGGDFEWREPGTGWQRITAETLVVCGRHELRGPEVRLTVRARNLILNRARITTEADGFYDIRVEHLSLEGHSKLVSRAKASAQPPFAASANINLSARTIDGAGRLDVETRGADHRAD